MTFDPRSGCPSSEALGAFAEGRLGAEERKAVIAHLDTCESCRAEVAALAEFADSEAEEPAPARPRSVWWLAAAAAVAVVVAALVWRGLPRRDAGSLAPLVAATGAMDHRHIEPRLGGFAWSAYRGAVRATEDDRSPEHLKVLGAAGGVLQDARTNPTPDANRAAGVASLLISDPAAAIERLRAATEARPGDAHAWSDLAAAHYELAVKLGRASEFPAALAAADRALKVDPRLPEALFNRALILERLGLIDDARAAWGRYLEVDAASEWATEARQRMNQLPATAKPAAARAFAEVELLARWAERQDDAPLAEARAIGTALQQRSGESLLAEAVRAIDDGDAATRARLAEAHLAYRGGRLALHRHELESARRELRRSLPLFGSSPFALNARYYSAIVDYEAGRVAAAREALDALANELPPSFKALRAQVAWQRGLIEALHARWPAALARYRDARARFAELGEASNAAFIDLLIGEAATMLGRRDEAWEGWARAFRSLSEHGFNDRLVVTLAMISQTESMAGRDAAASSILDLELAHASGDDRTRAGALFRRAILSARMRDTPGARRAVEEGARIAGGIDDANLRAKLRLAQGIAFADDAPRALASLGEAIEHYRAARPLLLPVALRERARVLRASGRIDEATGDLRAAVAAIEQQRGDVEWREVRATAVDGVEGIYAALVEALLERGLTDEAFTFADRAAVHAFYGPAATRSIATVDALQRSLGDDVVIEYVTLPRELAIFVVTAGGVAVKRAPVADLPRRVAALNEAIRTRRDVRGASLYPTLIEPVRNAISGAGTITFVPDATLAAVPFGALYDPGAKRWLIEEHAIRLAPSALAVPGERQQVDRAHALVIQPRALDLPSAASEAAAIAQRYRDAVVIDGESTSAVVAAMQNADVIHYAGHTDSSGETGLALGGSTLYGTDIARLHLRAPLVVLAGCRTMRGAAHGDDVATSLARAFLLAGARAVVGTAWDLDDRAGAALFERMHTAVAATGDPVAALREAQLTALSNSASEPADWAAAEIIVRSAMSR